MGLTVTDRLKVEAPAYWVGDITFDSSYATGGESLSPGDMGLSSAYLVLIEPRGGCVFEYDYVNQKVLARRTASHTHTENTSPTYVQNAKTAGGGVGFIAEVSSGVNLSAITTRVIAFGVR